MLPNLPKKYNRKEAEITPLVKRWFEDNYHKSVALEVKVGKNKTLSHQDTALNKVAQGCFGYKIPDMGRKVPFDIFILKDADAFVVTCNGRECEAIRKGDDYKFNFRV